MCGLYFGFCFWFFLSMCLFGGGHYFWFSITALIALIHFISMLIYQYEFLYKEVEKSFSKKKYAHYITTIIFILCVVLYVYLVKRIWW